MTGSGNGSQHSPFRVPLWQDLLGAWIDRQPKLWQRMGNRETAHLHAQLAGIDIGRPIYVCGLARSGTTILLELLASHPRTASHRYRDFPALFTPWLWNRFLDRARSRPGPVQERSHNDGILVNADSPEAFEEVLWSAFLPSAHDPDASAVLGPEHRDPDFEAFYADHLKKLLLLRSGTRYLAKGNYNIVRLGYLHRLFPDARFIIPVREPVWHIASLMQQHRRFCAIQAQDPRARRYMRRAGHFEFGLDRHPINTGAPEIADVNRLWEAGRDLDGWALYWTLIHDHLTATVAADPALAAATLIVRYEDFCAAPAATLARVLEHCDLAPEGLPEAAAARVQAPDYYRPGFSAAEEAEIRRITSPVARRLGYSGC